MGGEESGSLGSLRQSNRRRVVDTLRGLGIASRAEIARRTGLSRSTVSTIVADLANEGLVVDRDDGGASLRAAGAGRPPQPIALAPTAGTAVGIDFGKQHLAVAVSDLSHRVLAEEWREMDDDYPAETGLDAAADLVHEVLDRAGAPSERVLGVGLGLPGPIHAPSGTIGSSAILPGWAGVNARDQMQARLAASVIVENDANLGALAEAMWGAGRGAGSLVYLKVSTGIGAGLIIDGRVFPEPPGPVTVASPSRLILIQTASMPTEASNSVRSVRMKE